MQPLVSIGIPTFNRADSYLKDALKSAVSQTYQNIEIIVSDNCSQDNTEALVKSFNDPRIRYFKQSRNIGGQNNTNFCVERAKGDYFLLLHDDDLIDDDFISVCMEAVNYDTHVGIILTGTRMIDENGKIIHEDSNKAGGCSTVDFILAWFDCKVPLYLCSTLYNTQRLQEIGGFRSRKNLYDDNVVLFQLADKFGRKDIHDVKASFRAHSINSGISASIDDWCEDSLFLLEVMCKLSGDRIDEVRKAGMNYFCKVNYGYIRDRNIPSTIKRFCAYWSVYRKFEYCYSPLDFIFAQNLIYGSANRLISFFKRKTGEAFS